MAEVKSVLTTGSGVLELMRLLQVQADGGGEGLTMVDKAMAAYLWGKDVADQYPTRIQGAGNPNAGYEQLTGRLADLDI